MRPSFDSWLWIMVTGIVLFTTFVVLIHAPDRSEAVPAPAIAQPQ